jgi:peptidoglycan/LPS O-acetylase OafA/YrhL
LPASHLIYVLLPSRADALLIGVLCAYLLRQEKSRSWLTQNTRTLHVAFLFLALGVAYLVSLGYGYNAMRVRTSFELVTYGYTLLALFCASVLLIAILDKKSLIARVLRNRLLRHFGVLAYGIYIIHSAVRGILLDLFFGAEGAKATLLSRNLVSLLAFFAMWMLAMLSWRFFEGPIVRWGRSFRYAPEKAVKKEALISNAP